MLHSTQQRSVLLSVFSNYDSYLTFSTHIYGIYAIARYMLSSVRPSDCSSHGWISQKTVEVSIMSISSQNSPITLVSSWLTSPRSYKRNRGSGAPNERGVGKNTQFSANKTPYLRNGDVTKVTMTD